MYSKWISKITADNLDYIVEYCSRYGLLSREDIEKYLQLNATNGQESYLLVYNPESATRVEFHLGDDQAVRDRYILIPVYHPEGHLQQFEVNH